MCLIRRSLISYFLVLLGLALGAVGLLVDRFAYDAITAHKDSEARRIKQEHQTRCDEATRHFDEELERKAITLGRELRWNRSNIQQERFRDGRGDRSDRGRNREPEFWFVLSRVYLATMPINVSGWPTAIAAWGIANQRFDSSLSWAFQRAQTESQRADDDEHLRQKFRDGTEHPKYFQFYLLTPRRTLHNPNSDVVGDLPAASIDTYLNEQSFQSAYMDQIVNGEPVRAVVVKAPYGEGPFRLPPPSNLFRRTLPAATGGTVLHLVPENPDPQRYMYVHVGRPRAELNADLGGYQKQQDKDLAQLEEETRESIALLRSRIGLIDGITFLALATGGWLLVGYGIAPVRKLSDAVSRVSEKDFRLPVDRDALSHELLPIHTRLTTALDDLRQAFEREKQAVADISHELRTPVAGLLATLDVVLRRPRTAEQYRTALEESRAIGRQLAGLVERVMKLATLDAGADRTNLAEADLSEMAAGCAAVIRPLAEANGLTFEADLPGPVVATTDPDKLREVVTNLLHNAVEYNRPGGSIRLAVRRTETGGAEIEVADTGIGMTADVRSRIFERFYRADSSRHAAGAHAGLGLSIVKECIDRLGGTITVDSEAGVGSTFRVTLPAATSRNGRMPVQEPETALS